jgi:hypothetical protein
MDRIVKGVSMRPFLRALDICGTIEASPEGFDIGDIVVYKRGERSRDIIHRIVEIDTKAGYALIKGDNSGRGSCDKVFLADISEKVVKIKKQGREVDLGAFPHKQIGKILASLSRMDLTPSLIKARFVDPVLLSLASFPLYKKFRKFSYKNISFSSAKKEEECLVFAFVGGGKSADAVIKKDGKDVFVSSYIRYRDRNAVFAEKFMRKIIEVSDSEYGSDVRIRLNDKVMKLLVGSTDEFFFSDRISFK